MIPTGLPWSFAYMPEFRVVEACNLITMTLPISAGRVSPPKHQAGAAT